MTIKEAIKLRHMVRKYTDKPIPADLAEKLKERIAGNNQAHGLQIKLVQRQCGWLKRRSEASPRQKCKELPCVGRAGHARSGRKAGLLRAAI